jgi:hypothetical protein
VAIRADADLTIYLDLALRALAAAFRGGVNAIDHRFGAPEWSPARPPCSHVL